MKLIFHKDILKLTDLYFLLAGFITEKTLPFKKKINCVYLPITYINQNLSAMTIVNSFTTMWYTLGDILVLTKMREFLQSYKKPKLLWNWLLDTIVNYSWQRSGGRLRRGHMSDLIKKICFCTADFSKDLFLPRHRKKLDWKVKSILPYI